MNDSPLRMFPQAIVTARDMFMPRGNAIVTGMGGVVTSIRVLAATGALCLLCGATPLPQTKPPAAQEPPATGSNDLLVEEPEVEGADNGADDAEVVQDPDLESPDVDGLVEGVPLPAGATAPTPKARPKGAALKRALLKPEQTGKPPYGFEPAPALKRAMQALEQNRYREAMTLAVNLDHPIDRRLVEWYVARAPNSGLSSDRILEILEENGNWPDPQRLRLRAEQAFLQTPHEDIELIRFFRGTDPLTTSGKSALARVRLDQGRVKSAHSEIRNLWRTGFLSQSQMKRYYREFGDALTLDDHLYRLRRLVYDRKTTEARALATLMGPEYGGYVRAVSQALGRKRHSVALLYSVAPKMRNDSAYRLAQIRLLRRTDQVLAATQIMLRSPTDPDVLVDPDRWWDERRDLSRQLLDRNLPELAYRVAAEHSADSETDRVDAEFHAGWYALRFLDRPHVAKRHFQRIAGLADLPQTIARAHYWLGRAHEDTGHVQQARLSFAAASQHGSTYYGQLARDAIGLQGTGQEIAPVVTAGDRLAFAQSDLIDALRRLTGAGYESRSRRFFVEFARQAESAGQVALAATLARRIRQDHMIMTLTSVATRSGINVGSLSAPLIGVPVNVPVPDEIDRAMIYAVSRQESAFNPAAVSHAGARGLMQLMPATARYTARSIGSPFSESRLTKDARYNATLGAAHLAELMTSLGGSYIMTFVGYNAGPGRAVLWAKNYGDPRGGVSDPVDWIERIPFDETRNYVQKVMGNLQAYRARLGRPISPYDDLTRGTPRG